MKRIWDYIVPDHKLSDSMLVVPTYDHLGFYKPLQSFGGNDPFDLWRTKWLSRQIFEDMEKRGYCTQDLKRESKKIDILLKLRYLYLVFGGLFGALVINPAYIGKTSRPIRMAVPILSAFAFFKVGDYISQYYAYYVKTYLYDKLPYHYRKCMETKDSRYLNFLDLNDQKLNKYNEETNKFLY